SSPPDSRRVPSGENATDRTAAVWPLRVRMSAPELASHSLSVWSQPPDSTRLPSGERATEKTQLDRPSKVRIKVPVAASQSFTAPAVVARQQAGPIWREPCRPHIIRLSVESMNQRPGGRVPELQSFLPIAGEHAGPIGRECQRILPRRSRRCTEADRVYQ